MAYGLTQSANIIAGSQLLTRADTASLSITGQLTYEVWVEIKTAPTNNNTWLLAKGDGGDFRSAYVYYADSGGAKSLAFFVTDSGNNAMPTFATCSVSQTLTLDTWYHVAAVFTPSTRMEIFLNGSSIGAITSSIPTAVFDGNDPTDICGFTGGVSGNGTARFSLARVWSTARTGAQITASMCQVLGATANLAAEWTLDNTLNDNSGNSNTLSNIGTATFVSDVPATCQVVAFKGDSMLLMGVG